MSGNLIALRRRIHTVRNTQKLTKAMKTVAAAKLRRTTTDLARTRPYMDKLEALLKEVGPRLKSQDHPLMRQRPSDSLILVVVTADKGLCGSFNSHIIKKTEVHYRQRVAEGMEVRLVTAGNKGFRYFSKNRFPIAKAFPSLISRFTPSGSRQLADYLQEQYIEEEIRGIEMISTQFKSASRQSIEVTSLFPLHFPPPVESDSPDTLILEPDADALFQTLLPRYIHSRIHRLVLGSIAAEESSRMLAMDLATHNASDMARSLQLALNKLRQATITKELLEIMTATEALSK